MFRKVSLLLQKLLFTFGISMKNHIKISGFFPLVGKLGRLPSN